MTISDLKGIRAAHAKIRSLQRRVDRLRDAMYSPSSPVLSHTPKGSAISDPTANAALTITGMTLRLLGMIMDLETQIEAAERCIATLPEDEQALIRARYIDGMTWRQVSRECNWSIDHCFTKHRQILAKLNSI